MGFLMLSLLGSYSKVNWYFSFGQKLLQSYSLVCVWILTLGLLHSYSEVMQYF